MCYRVKFQSWIPILPAKVIMDATSYYVNFHYEDARQPVSGSEYMVLGWKHPVAIPTRIPDCLSIIPLVCMIINEGRFIAPLLPGSEIRTLLF